MTKLANKPTQLRELALRRLAQRRQPHPAVCAEIERLRAEGCMVIGGPAGYVVLPAEKD